MSTANAILAGEMVTQKNDREHYIVSFLFRYASEDGIGMQFNVDPVPSEPIEWQALVDAIKTNQKYTLSMTSEGYVTIGHADGQVSFDIDNCTCDGNLKLTMPADKCVAAIEKCAVAFATHDPRVAVSS